MRWRGEEGQASNEYVALLAIVAVVFLSAVALTAGGLGSQVLDGMRRGLCMVTLGPCPKPIVATDVLRPCPVERKTRQDDLDETIASVKLGSSGTLTEVLNSDGTATVTLADGSNVGVEWGIGGKVALGHTLGGDASASAALAWGSGRSWDFPDAAAAQAFIDRYGDKATMTGKLVDEVRSRCSILCDAIGWRPHAELPTPDATYKQGGVIGKLSADVGSRHGEAGASALLGRRVARDGETTWYVQLDASLAAQLRLPLAELRGNVGGSAVLAYTTGADGRPRQLALTMAGEGAAQASLGGEAKRGSSKGNGAARQAARGLIETEATLDLGDGAVRAVASDVVDALAHGRVTALPDRVRALGKAISDHGQIDVRVYDEDADAKQFGGSLALGIKIGGGFARTTKGLRLVAATTRLPGLPFLPRDDCHAA
jgi:hypothetical protein